MPEKLTTNHALETIELRSFGRVEPEEMFQSRNSISDLVNETGYRRVYIDASKLENMPGSLTTYELAAGFQGAGLPEGCRFAIVGSQRIFGRLSFFETMGRSHGISVRIFTGRDDAFAWLAGVPTADKK